MGQNIISELNFYKFNCDPLYDEKIAQKVTKLANFPQKSLILDAACGDGYWGKVFASGGCRTIGLDLSKDSISRAKAKSLKGQKFVLGNLLEKLPFPKENFDGIVCGGILHHLPAEKDIKVVLNNLSFCLKRDGKLVVVEPNGSNPIMILSRILGRFLVKIYPFVATANETVHSVKVYKRTFDSCGLNIIVSDQYRHDPNGKIKIDSFFNLMQETRRRLFNFVWKVLPPEFGGNETLFIVSKKK